MKEAAIKKLLTEKQSIIEKAGNQSKLVETQLGMLFDGLIEIIETDERLAGNIVQEHKSFERCYKYMENKAKKLAGSGAQSCCVRSDMLFDWVREYYALDDLEAFNKEKKAKEEREQAMKRAEERRKNGITPTVTPTPKPSTTPVAPVKKNKKEDPNQMSLFDLMGMA